MNEMPGSQTTVDDSTPRGINLPLHEAHSFAAAVPDTLDLAERAQWGLGHFLNLISEKHGYEMYWGVHIFYPEGMNSLLGYDLPQQWGGTFADYSPGILTFNPTTLMGCQAKAAEAMVMLRIMSGSRERRGLEERMLSMLVSNIAEDGVYYVPSSGGDAPWRGPEEWRPYANTHGQARMLRAMMAWFQYTGNPIWKAHIDRMVDGMDRRLVVHKDDYAFFPTSGWVPQEYFRSCFLKERGWKSSEQPVDEKGGEEGSLFNHQGHTPGALANWYGLSGNKQALRLAGQLVRFYMRPEFWADVRGGEYPGTVGNEHAHFQGHWHGHVNTLRAMLEYAIAVNDSRLKSFARDGYEWARQSGIARIGLFGDGQGCACGRIIGLAVKLTDAGVGDYWEDVDQYIRNQGTEMQYTPEDAEYLRATGNGKPAPPSHPSIRSDHVIEATIGGFSSGHAPLKVSSGICCDTHGSMGLFYAWEGTLRHSNGVVRVNLLLNRASPWLDVDSYLPYEGRVVLRNKAARQVFVRMPLWVDCRQVTCRVGDKATSPDWVDRYIHFERLSPDDIVTIEFPVEEWTETWTAPPASPFPLRLPLPGVRFQMTFRGNTLVQLSQPLGEGCPLYQQRPARFRARQTPMRDVERRVTTFHLRW